MKRIISIFLTAALLLSLFSFPVYSADEGWQGLLDVLNVTGDSGESTFVTRGEFLSVLLKTLNTDYSGHSENPVFADVTVGHKYYGQIMFAVKSGIVNGSTDGRFYPDDYIKPEHAAIMIIRAMGYGERYADSGYFDTMNYLGLFKDTDMSYGFVDRNSMKQIMINILMAPYPTESYDISNIFKYGEERTFLEVRWGLHYGTGIADATETRSLTGFASKSGYVSIGGESYISAEQITERYFGMKVRYFYSEDSGEKTLKYAYPLDNTVDEHLGDEFSSFNGKQLVFFDENGKTRTYEADGKTSLIRNNKNMRTADFKSKVGNDTEKFIIIDNDSDGIADVIEAYTYTVYVPKLVDIENEIIVGENKNLSFGRYKKCVVYDSDGNKMDIESVKKNTHYLVYDPEDYGYSITITESEITAEGTVASLNSSDSSVVLTTGDEYRLSPSAAVKFSEIKMGFTYSFYFDGNRKIIDISQTSGDSVQAVYFIAAEEKTGIKSVNAKVLRENGTIEFVSVASKVDFRDSNGTQSQVSSSEAFGKMKSAGEFVPQIAFVKFNNSGEITKITLPCSDYSKDYHLQDYSKMTSNKDAMRRWMSAQYSFENQIQLKASTKVFVVPYHELDQQDDEYYSVASVSMFNNDTTYKINEFDGPINGRYTSIPIVAEPEEFAADYFVLECPAKTKFTSGSTNYGLVTEIKDCYDVDTDTEFKRISILSVSSGTVSNYDFSFDDGVCDRNGVPIGRGDIIKITSSGGLLKKNNALVFYDFDEDEYKFITSYDVGSGASNEIGWRFYADLRLTEGVVEEIRGNIAKCTNMRDKRTTTYTEYVSLNQASIVEFNTSKVDYEIKSISYLKPGDRYVAMMRNGLFKYVIFYGNGG